MSTDLMIDIETLGTRPDCVILTVGAIKFDPASQIEPHTGFYHRLDVDEQLASGRTVDQDTLDWWNTQPVSVRDEALGEEDRTNISQFIKELNKQLVGVKSIWAQGPTFDFVILENLYRQVCAPIPWHYWQIRDSRTLFQVAGDPRVAGRNQAHNALADCYYQAKGVQSIYQKFGFATKK